MFQDVSLLASLNTPFAFETTTVEPSDGDERKLGQISKVASPLPLLFASFNTL